MPRVPWKHGTTGGYTNHGCHCEACMEAVRVYRRERNWVTGRRRPMAQWVADRPKPQHGGERMYRNGCRCALCVEGFRLRRRRYRRSLGVPERGPLKPCGTRAAYERHLYHGEEPCEPCLEAKRARDRARYWARKRVAAA